MKFDAVTIGDYSLDIILQIADNKAHIRLDENFSEIALSRDEKILVDGMGYGIGGNSCNVAVGLSRLGLKTSYVTNYGTEWWKELFLDEMKNENIDLSGSVVQDRVAANYSTSLFFRQEKTILVHNVPNDYSVSSSWSEAKMLYVSSVGPNFATFFEELSDFVYRQKIILAFNPASHQFEKTVSYYKNLLAVCEFLFVNKKEAQKIVGEKDEDVSSLVKKLSTFGPKHIILTNQINGAYYFGGDKLFYCEIYPLEVVQKTGAGDAFASGFLAGYFHTESPQEALRWGTFNSAFVINKQGPHDGLQRIEEMEHLTKENQAPVVKQVSP